MFIIAIISTAITYTAFSMNQITELAETIEIKQITDLQKTTEKYEIVSIRTDNNQFNMTVVNTGDLPVHLTRLWVENTTDSSVYKYDLDFAIPTGGSVDDIGQNIGLTALDTSSYMMILITERGNTQKMYVNGIGAQSTSVYLNLRATPTIVPTTFTTTIVLEVINTGTNQLLNVTPNMDDPVDSCTVTCDAVIVSGPTPTSFDSLDPGDIAIFEWVYTMTGDDSGDSSLFTASLVNGVAEVTTTVAVQSVLSAENSEVSLITSGVADVNAINDSILIFHMEQDNVPSPGYQMASSSIDGGSTGLTLSMDTYLAANPVSFWTNNGTLSVTVPSGDWVASLALRSEAVAPTVDTDYDMIFHFNSNEISPDNSEGDGNRDLEECGALVFSELIATGTDDAEEDTNDGDTNTSSSDMELMYDNGSEWKGFRWSLDVPQGAVINSAYIQFVADGSNPGPSPDILIGAEKTNNPGTFVSGSDQYNISNRWADVTTNTVVWDSIPSWSDDDGRNEWETNTRTPDLSVMIKEIVDESFWSTGEHIVIIFKDEGGGSEIRKAESYNGAASYAPTLVVNYGASSGSPEWQATAGPHISGAYYYDGVTECHRSVNPVSDGNGNDLEKNDSTTSLWFKTDGDGDVSSEQMLVFWEGEENYPTSDYYKISIGSDASNRGKILFEFDVSLGTQPTTCLSTLEYDDEKWYHVVAVRTQTGSSRNTENCDMYITDVNGVDMESVHPPGIEWSGSYVGQDSPTADRWYVATRAETDGFFKGWIDDIMHWNEDPLSSSEVVLLSHTNYGTGAHQLDVFLNLTDSSGTTVQTLYDGAATPISFLDSKGYDSDDVLAYTMHNVTIALPQINITSVQRLNFSMNFVPPTSIWEPLDLDMAVDDIDFSPGYSSFIQIPFPNNPFASYTVYDPNTELELFVNNIGNDGIYFVYSGTRLSFFSETLGSYATLIHYVNGTSGSYVVNIDTDSIYIPTGDSAQLIFYKIPTNRPCAGGGGNCGDTIPDGTYSMSAWINGYSDQGETFGRTIQVGIVTVES